MTRIQLVRELLNDPNRLNEEVFIRDVLRDNQDCVIEAIEAPISYVLNGSDGFKIAIERPHWIGAKV